MNYEKVSNNAHSVVKIFETNWKACLLDHSFVSIKSTNTIGRNMNMVIRFFVQTATVQSDIVL